MGTQCQRRSEKPKIASNLKLLLFQIFSKWNLTYFLECNLLFNAVNVEYDLHENIIIKRVKGRRIIMPPPYSQSPYPLYSLPRRERFIAFACNILKVSHI